MSGDIHYSVAGYNFHRLLLVARLKLHRCTRDRFLRRAEFAAASKVNGAVGYRLQAVNADTIMPPLGPSATDLLPG